MYFRNQELICGSGGGGRSPCPGSKVSAYPKCSHIPRTHLLYSIPRSHFQACSNLRSYIYSLTSLGEHKSLGSFYNVRFPPPPSVCFKSFRRRNTKPYGSSAGLSGAFVPAISHDRGFFAGISAGGDSTSPISLPAAGISVVPTFASLAPASSMPSID